MTIYFLELPGWHFDACEVSSGVYKITGRWGDEQRVERMGSDTTGLLEQCHRDALEVVNAARESGHPGGGQEISRG